jgi:hypothetical protein
MRNEDEYEISTEEAIANLKWIMRQQISPGRRKVDQGLIELLQMSLLKPMRRYSDGLVVYRPNMRAHQNL